MKNKASPPALSRREGAGRRKGILIISLTKPSRTGSPMLITSEYVT